MEVDGDPLVRKNSVNPVLLRNFDDCIRLLDLAYKLCKCDQPDQVGSPAGKRPPVEVHNIHVRDYEISLNQKGWTITRINDSARLACNQDKGLFVVVFCGSVTQKDWEVNLHCRPSTSHRFRGGVHTGYLASYEQLRAQLLAALSALPSLPWHCISLGYGSGGACATLALLDIIESFGTRWHGANFNNAARPRFFGYFISSPPSLTASVISYLNHVVGEYNMLSQFAESDIFCNGWSTLLKKLIHQVEMLNSDTADGLLAQLTSITWHDELELYRYAGQLSIQTVHGASLRYTSVQEQHVPVGSNSWALFRHVLTTLGLTAHLGGSTHEGEFIRWLVERPTPLHLDKGAVLRKERQIREDALDSQQPLTLTGPHIQAGILHSPTMKSIHPMQQTHTAQNNHSAQRGAAAQHVPVAQPPVVQQTHTHQQIYVTQEPLSPQRTHSTPQNYTPQRIHSAQQPRTMQHVTAGQQPRAQQPVPAAQQPRATKQIHAMQYSRSEDNGHTVQRAYTGQGVPRGVPQICSTIPKIHSVTLPSFANNRACQPVLGPHRYRT